MIENIYVSILQEKLGFENVNYTHKDNHAFYFRGKERDNSVNIKVRTDSDNIEVWSKLVNSETWGMVSVYV
jgi:hypothetical protein